MDLRLTSQEISLLLRNLTWHWLVYRSKSLGHIEIQINPVHIFVPLFFLGWLKNAVKYAGLTSLTNKFVTVLSCETNKVFSLHWYQINRNIIFGMVTGWQAGKSRKDGSILETENLFLPSPKRPSCPCRPLRLLPKWVLRTIPCGVQQQVTGAFLCPVPILKMPGTMHPRTQKQFYFTGLLEPLSVKALKYCSS
jgi:hypothetical protein